MDIAIIVVLILCSAFFSASETAFSSVNRIRLKSLAEGGTDPHTKTERKGSKAAARALKILGKYDKALTTILIGNNIVNIATSSLATIVSIALVGEKYGSLVATAATTVIVLIFGEVMPKSIAKDYAEEVCIGISGIISFLMFIFTPFSALFILMKKLFAKLFHKKNSVSMTEEELMVVIDEIENEGVLEQQEGNLVRSALQFDEITVDEIITPRVRLVAVDVTDSASEVRAKFLSEEYSRMPVYEKNIDNIIGIINEKDFIKAYEAKGRELTVRELIQETIYFPSMLKISEVLRTMQKKKCHMGVVLDQHGGTLGIVTLEDLLEELVGEIWDESDEVISPVTVLSDNTFEVYGDVSLNSLRRFFDSRELDAEIDSEAHTVAGWVLGLFGSIPENGAVVQTDLFTVTVLEVSELRIKKVRIAVKRQTEQREEN